MLTTCAGKSSGHEGLMRMLSSVQKSIEESEPDRMSLGSAPGILSLIGPMKRTGKNGLSASRGKAFKSVGHSGGPTKRKPNVNQIKS